MPVCVISQPRFFPGLHYLHRMLIADIFVILDTVQFTPRHEENRAKLKSPEGTLWLTVPVHKTGRDQRIFDTRIHREQPWQKSAVKTLSHLYGKSPQFAAHSAEIFRIIEAPHETLTGLDQASWAPALRLLETTCKIVCASDLPVHGSGPRLLLDICKHLGADVYLSGAFGREYLDTTAFTAEGVEVRFHEYAYPTYEQRFGAFVPFLSYLDALFNVGLDRSLVMRT